MRKKNSHVPAALLLFCIVFFVVACSGGAASSAKPAATATIRVTYTAVTPTPTSKPPCEVNALATNLQFEEYGEAPRIANYVGVLNGVESGVALEPRDADAFTGAHNNSVNTDTTHLAVFTMATFKQVIGSSLCGLYAQAFYLDMGTHVGYYGLLIGSQANVSQTSPNVETFMGLTSAQTIGVPSAITGIANSNTIIIA